MVALCEHLLMATGSRSARLRDVLGWPIGIAVVSWRYLWRTTPPHRSEGPGTRNLCRAGQENAHAGPTGHGGPCRTISSAAGGGRGVPSCFPAVVFAAGGNPSPANRPGEVA
jgi:hypothetical protein